MAHARPSCKRRWLPPVRAVAGETSYALCPSWLHGLHTFGDRSYQARRGRGCEKMEIDSERPCRIAAKRPSREAPVPIFSQPGSVLAAPAKARQVTIQVTIDPSRPKTQNGLAPIRRRNPLIIKPLPPLFLSGQGESRTHDTRIFSPLLYYLSYLSKMPYFHGTIDTLPTLCNNATTPDVTPDSRKDTSGRGRSRATSFMQGDNHNAQV